MSNQKRFALIGRGFGSAAFDEAVTDLIGGILVDSSEINFTYTDATPAITASLIDASVAFARLQNFDALSVLGRAANSSGVSDEIAAGANDRLLRRTSDTLNFGQLTAGMFPNTVVPDAALSSNVPLLNAADQTFTGILRVDGVSEFRGSPAFRIKNATSGILYLEDSGAGAGLKNWMLRSNDGEFVIQSLDDNESGVENGLRFTMDSSSTITLVQLNGDEIELNATTFDFNGALDLSGNATLGGNLSIVKSSPVGIFQDTGGSATDMLAFFSFRDSGGTERGWFGFGTDDTEMRFVNTIGVLTLRGGDVNGIQVDNSTTAGNTRLLVYDVDNATLERVTVGAADSGGAGFKVLRIPN